MTATPESRAHVWEVRYQAVAESEHRAAAVLADLGACQDVALGLAYGAAYAIDGDFDISETPGLDPTDGAGHYRVRDADGNHFADVYLVPLTIEEHAASLGMTVEDYLAHRDQDQQQQDQQQQDQHSDDDPTAGDR